MAWIEVQLEHIGLADRDSLLVEDTVVFAAAAAAADGASRHKKMLEMEEEEDRNCYFHRMLDVEEEEDKHRRHHHRKKLAKEEERLVSVAVVEVSHHKGRLEMEVREGRAIADRDNLLVEGTVGEVSHHKAIAEVGGMSCCCHKRIAEGGSLDVVVEEGMRRSLQDVMLEGEGESCIRRKQVGQQQVSPNV